MRFSDSHRVSLTEGVEGGGPSVSPERFEIFFLRPLGCSILFEKYRDASPISIAMPLQKYSLLQQDTKEYLNQRGT